MNGHTSAPWRCDDGVIYGLEGGEEVAVAYATRDASDALTEFDLHNIPRIVACDHGVQQGGVNHRASKGTGLIQRRGEGHQAITRDCTVSRLGANNSRDSCWLTNRPSGVSADRQRSLIGRNCGSRATR